MSFFGLFSSSNKGDNFDQNRRNFLINSAKGIAVASLAMSPFRFVLAGEKEVNSINDILFSQIKEISQEYLDNGGDNSKLTNTQRTLCCHYAYLYSQNYDKFSIKSWDELREQLIPCSIAFGKGTKDNNVFFYNAVGKKNYEAFKRFKADKKWNGIIIGNIMDCAEAYLRFSNRLEAFVTKTIGDNQKTNNPIDKARKDLANDFRDLPFISNNNGVSQFNYSHENIIRVTQILQNYESKARDVFGYSCVTSDFIKYICTIETTYGLRIRKSSAGANGLLQVKPVAQKQYSKYFPNQNREVLAILILFTDFEMFYLYKPRREKDEFDVNLQAGLAYSYNQGWVRFENFLRGKNSFREGRKYMEKAIAVAENKFMFASK